MFCARRGLLRVVQRGAGCADGVGTAAYRSVGQAVAYGHGQGQGQGWTSTISTTSTTSMRFLSTDNTNRDTTTQQKATAGTDSEQAPPDLEHQESTEEYEYEDVVPPDLENLETRWTNLKQEDQHDIMDYLKDQQELSWRSDLNRREKQAAYYLAYGNWGPRDAAQLNLPEFIFRLMSSSLLFSVLGFSLVNYLNDKDQIAVLEASAAGPAPTDASPE